MNSKTYYDSNGQLAMPLVPPVQGTEGFDEYSSTSARLSRLNPDLVLGNISSPILNVNTNSGPSIGASSLVTDVTYGTNFQRTTSSSINFESYQNLPSSPLSVSSRNMSDLAIDDTSAPLLTESLRNHINQVARRRERSDHDMSSLFKGKERELLDDLAQTSKKPRFHADAAHITQELLQKHSYNQQLKTLSQQHEFQKLKQKDVLQSQYVTGPSQLQMRLYLQQLAKNSAPVIRPLPSDVCSRRLMQLMYHFQHRPSDNNITYWRTFVAEYYAPCAKKRWCLSLYDCIGEHSLGVFSQLAMEAWRCGLCGSKSGKGFEINFELLPRLYKTYFESGVLDELLFLDLPYECTLSSGLIFLRYEKAVQETIYEKFRIVREGQLRIIFRSDLKILAWEFCARCHDEVVPRRLIAPQVNELAQTAETYHQGKSGFSKVAVQNLQSTCKMFVAAEGQLMKNLDSVLVNNDLGFPKKYIRCLQISEIVTSMKDLMTFSLDNNIGPRESMVKYSREGYTSNTQKKQAEIPATSEAVLRGSKLVHGQMSCHQKMQNSTSNPENQKPFGSASSTLSEFDNKTQEQMIGKILQQMESNTREKAILSNNVKVEVQEVENLGATLTADVENGGIGGDGNVPDSGNKNTFVWKSVPKNVSNVTGSSKSTSSNVGVKQEPDDDDIYKDLYLSEAIMDVDKGFFRVGALNDE